MSNRSRNLPNRQSEAAREAREQAAAYDSLFSEQEIELEDGTKLMIPPHPDFGMLDDDEMDAYEELQFKLDTEYDRFPDVYIPEQKLKDPTTGKENGVVIPADTQRGELMRPFRIKDQLVKPPHSRQIVMAALGEVKYKQLKEGGRSAADVWRIWGRQGVAAKARQAADPFPDGSPQPLASVSEADSE